MEKPKLPKFSGDVREYAIFCSDFKHAIESRDTKRDSITLLRTCLKEKPPRAHKRNWIWLRCRMGIFGFHLWRCAICVWHNYTGHRQIQSATSRGRCAFLRSRSLGQAMLQHSEGSWHSERHGQQPHVVNDRAEAVRWWPKSLVQRPATRM